MCARQRFGEIAGAYKFCTLEHESTGKQLTQLEGREQQPLVTLAPA